MEPCFYILHIFALFAVSASVNIRNTNQLKENGVLIIGGMNDKVLNGGASLNDIYHDIEVFPENCRGPVPDLPMQNAVSGSYKGDVVACGGVNMTDPEYGYLSLDCFRLSEENTWEMIAPMNMARTQFYSVLVEVGDVLVAIFNPYDGLTTMEVYDGETWTMRPDLELGLSNFPETVDLTTGEFVGRDDSHLSYVKNSFIFTLDIRTGVWERHDMEAVDGDDETMFQAKAQNMGDGILRTGGTNFAKSTNVTTFINLESGNGDWEIYPSLNFARFAHATAQIDGIQMVFGGAQYDMGRVLPVFKSTEIFQEGSWVKGDDMKKGRLGHKVVAIQCDG